MKMREMVQPLIHYKVGGGRDTFTWYGSWHKEGPLVKKFGRRIMYDAASGANCKLSNYIVNGEWVFDFPRHASLNLRFVVSNLPAITPYTHDWVEWMPNAAGGFCSRSAVEVMREHRDQVNRYNIVWFKGNIPRQAVIVWLIFKRKLMTRDRLFQWGCVSDDQCVLCNSATESIEHLFFECSFGNAIWREASRMNLIHRAAGRWEEESARCIVDGAGSSFTARIRCATMSAAIYFIWYESV